jgi:hypothetical protein
MWKSLLILGVIALAITSGFLITGTQAGLNAGSSTPGSAQVGNRSHAGAFFISSANYFLAHPSAATLRLRTWFATITPSPISLLILGGGLLLLGAFLRRRQNRPGDLAREK